MVTNRRFSSNSIFLVGISNKSGNIQPFAFLLAVKRFLL